jgi:hypothetical protein
MQQFGRGNGVANPTATVRVGVLARAELMTPYWFGLWAFCIDRSQPTSQFEGFERVEGATRAMIRVDEIRRSIEA